MLKFRVFLIYQEKYSLVKKAGPSEHEEVLHHQLRSEMKVTGDETFIPLRVSRSENCLFVQEELTLKKL